MIVREGYMDVIALAQVGLTHAVAALGTAIGEAQLAQLWQFADEPLICLDGDEAGLQAGHRLAERALAVLKNRASRYGSPILPRGGTPIRCCVPAAALSAERRRSSWCSTRRSRSWTFWARETATRSPTRPQQRWALERLSRARAAFRSGRLGACCSMSFRRLNRGAKEARRAVAAWSRRQLTREA